MKTFFYNLAVAITCCFVFAFKVSAQLSFEYTKKTVTIATQNPNAEDSLYCSFPFTNKGEMIEIVHVMNSHPGFKLRYPSKIITGANANIDIAVAQKDLLSLPTLKVVTLWLSNQKKVRLHIEFEYAISIVEELAKTSNDLYVKLYAGQRYEEAGNATLSLYWYNVVANEPVPQGTNMNDSEKRLRIRQAREKLGNLYYEGEMIKKNEKKALYWYEKAQEVSKSKSLLSGEDKVGKRIEEIKESIQ